MAIAENRCQANTIAMAEIWENMLFICLFVFRLIYFVKSRLLEMIPLFICHAFKCCSKRSIYSGSVLHIYCPETYQMLMDHCLGDLENCNFCILISMIHFQSILFLYIFDILLRVFQHLAVVSSEFVNVVNIYICTETAYTSDYCTQFILLHVKRSKTVRITTLIRLSLLFANSKVVIYFMVHMQNSRKNI